MKFFIQIIPIVSGIFVAFMWAVFYILFENMHGMQSMFNEQFPFIIGYLLDLSTASLSFGKGIILAVLDGLFIGYIFGWFVRKIFNG